MDVGAITAGLDEAQLAAVTATDMPLVVLAGAGSGKTRVLTRRIGYRAATGDLDPRFVLAVTFTRRAAGELRRRLAGLGLREVPAAGTFHGIAYAQLRSRWADRGIRPPAVLDRPAPFIGRLLDRHDPGYARLVATEIAWAKARLVTPETYADAARDANRRPPGPAGRVAELFASYEQTKTKRRVVDFDDLLRLCAHDLVRDTAFGAAVRWQVRHVFVDEFQDVNPLQFALLQAWMGDRRDLCVVGDADQAIYAWNGADARYLTELHRWFGPCGTVELRANHRSTAEVVAVGRAVLGEGSVPPTRRSGPLPQLTSYESDTEEYRGLARTVRDLRAPGRSWSDQAVLVRTHAVAVGVAQALAAAGIPHRVRGGIARRDVLDAALLPLEGLDWAVARRELAMLADPDQTDPEQTAAEPADAGSGRRAGRRPDPELVDALVALADDYAAIDPAPSVERFTSWLTTAEAPDARSDAVDVATFHAAKGLEWPVVHICALEDGCVPISHATTPAALDEERRLLHVAITRATEIVRFSWSKRRRFGERVAQTEPSPWVEVIEATVARLAAEENDRPPGLATAVLAPQRARLRPAGAPGGDPVAEALDSWRRRRAKAADVAPDHVLSDAAVAAVAAARPRTPADVAAIAEIGPVRASRWADSILEVVERAAGPTAASPGS
ncbi:MAG: UvrD-helicase domain-containing protein [Actinomycetota bacterium]|nr:UvrD-helicase domain-containing protein [Actinomycetota bacterium]